MLEIILLPLLVGQLVLTNPCNAISYRLPQEVKPLRYHIELRPDFQNDIFTGDVSIEVIALKNVNTITLNEYQLQMPSADQIEVIDVEANTRINVITAGPGESPDQQFFKLSLANSIAVGKQYLIKIPNFTGVFRTSPGIGFYYALYNDEFGNVKVLATTQFEAVGARKAFPCFDEPALKARFNLVIKRPSSSYISAANTPRDEILSSGLTDVFKETDLMSTYLVAFVVSEMQFSETNERHRVLAPSFELEKGRHRFSLNDSYYILNEMESYAEVPYTFEKLDHASIPHDYYDAGAMENWGLITYRDDILLVSPNAAAAYKQQASTVVAHEIGHQWFGNLVSPEWWEYVWLNEGFANYFEHYLPDKVHPEWDIWRKFTVQSGGSALRIDGIPSYTRPMNKPVEKPNDIMTLFDTIAYQKSGAVLRMLENVLSYSVFRQGLIYYLQDRGFKGATPSDLYSNLQRAVDESSVNVLPSTVADFMTTWDSVSGFPLVTVTRTYGNGTGNVQLKQKRFNNNNNQGAVGKWSIPINYVTKSNPSVENTSPQVWLQTAQDTITIPNLQDSNWLVVNKKQTGYYRVNYDVKNWNLISDALMQDHHQIDALNRAQLINDCRYVADSGDIANSVCQKLEEYALNEDDPLVWSVILSGFTSLDNKMYYTNVRNEFKQRVLYLLQGIYNRLTFEEKVNDTPSEGELRGNIIFWLCKMGHVECKTKSLIKFIAWKNEREEISEDLQPSMFCGAMRNGNQDDFSYLFNLFIETKDYKFQTRLASGLSCIENAKYLKKLLYYSLDKKCPSLLKYITKTMYHSSQIGLQTVVDFITNNFVTIQKMYEDKFRSEIEELATNLYSLEHLRKLKRLELRTKSVGVLERALTTVLDNVNWFQKNKPKLEHSMKSFRY